MPRGWASSGAEPRRKRPSSRDLVACLRRPRLGVALGRAARLLVPQRREQVGSRLRRRIVRVELERLLEGRDGRVDILQRGELGCPVKALHRPTLQGLFPVPRIQVEVGEQPVGFPRIAAVGRQLKRCHEGNDGVLRPPDLLQCRPQ